MVNRKLDNAIRQVVTDALRNLNYPCYHSSLNVWGNEVIIAYPESPGSETYNQLRGKLETYRVSLPVDDNTDLQALGKWSETYPIDILRETMECHELCGWSLLAHDGEGVIYHGRATAVHYALYLPNLQKLYEERI